jgi:hypothetical protein
MHGNTRVWALTNDGPEWMTLARARRENHYILECAKCDRPAYHLDHLAPYHQEMNRCKEHNKE